MESTGNFQPLGTHPQEKNSRLLIYLLLGGIFIMSTLAFAYSLKAYNNGNSVPNTPNTPGIVNLDPEKQKIKAYMQTQYFSDLIDLTSQWRSYFDTIQPTDKSVVIFDIDDTLLWNYPEILRSDFGFIPKEFNAWVESASAPAINQTKDFFLYLQKRNFKLIAITGRNFSQEAATRQNFASVGIGGWSDMIFRTMSEQPPMTATVYKSTRRMRLTQEQGWNIVGCCGDQISDCAGGYAGYIMKVPNYAYFLP
jgi:hypothetical protein